MTERITEKLSPGYLFGDYELLEHIGSGNFAMVYAARSVTSGINDDLVAIKILRPVIAQSDDGVRRFEREASHLKDQGHHPNIAQIDKVDSIDSSTISEDLLTKREWAIPPDGVDDIAAVETKCSLTHSGKKHLVGDCPEKPEGFSQATGRIHYMVGTYYPDGNLREWIEGVPKETWNYDRALKISIQIAKGISWIQSELPVPALVHQDLNPNNILIKICMNDEIPKIGDFGIARVVGEGSRGFVTHGWGDPQQGKTADPRFDQYSFGGIVFWLFTGERPFEKIEGGQVQDKDLNQLCFEFNVPDEVSVVIQKCRDNSFDDRFPDFDAIIKELEKARSIPKRELECDTKALNIRNRIEPVYLGIAFVVVATSLVLVDILVGRTESRWVEWAQWPILGVGLIFGGLILYTSPTQSGQYFRLPTLGVMILITGLAFGLWIGWSGDSMVEIKSSDVPTLTRPSTQLKVIDSRFTTREYGRIEVVIENPSDDTSLIFPDILMTTTPAMTVNAEGLTCPGSGFGGCFGDVKVLPRERATMGADLQSLIPGSFTFHFTGTYHMDGDPQNKEPFSIRHSIVVEPESMPNDSAYLELDSRSGYPGDSVEMIGVGFPPDQLVDMMTIGGTSVMPPEPLRISGDGTLRVVMTVPDIVAGEKALFVGSFQTFATEKFTVLGDIRVQVPPTVWIPPMPTGTPVPKPTLMYTPTSGPTSTPNPTLVTAPAAPATLDFDVSYGYPGDSIEITGSGYGSYQCVDEMTIGGVSVKPGTCVLTGSDGSFTRTVSIPSVAAGAKTVYIEVEDRSATGLVYVLTPNLTLPRIYGYPGEELEINGSMFTPGETVTEMTLGGVSVLSGLPIVVDGSGGFSGSFVIPRLSTGAHEMYIFFGDDVNGWSDTVYVLETDGVGTPSSD